jgi:hypothetical protein
MFKRQKKPPEPVHQPGTAKGEERLQREGKEPGLYHDETAGAERRTGKATPRIASGIVTKGAIDPSSPYLPPA